MERRANEARAEVYPRGGGIEPSLAADRTDSTVGGRERCTLAWCFWEAGVEGGLSLFGKGGGDQREREKVYERPTIITSCRRVGGECVRGGGSCNSLSCLATGRRVSVKMRRKPGL